MKTVWIRKFIKIKNIYESNKTFMNKLIFCNKEINNNIKTHLCFQFMVLFGKMKEKKEKNQKNVSYCIITFYPF
jgi:hypothetical protein